ncbi:MAG: tetratricopeptide repeat protein [Sphingopyxis sp.]|nr:tetratricopeptide repeat protein [Sphingopyxis sp.]
MATTPNSNPDTFVREVDDAVRADRMANIVRDYGRWIIGVILVGLIGFGGWLWWQSHQASVAGENGRTFLAALDKAGEGQPKGAATAVEPLAKGDDATYRALALMLQGNVALADGDVRTAVTRFGSVANNAELDPALRNLALVRQTLAEFDTLAPEAVVARLRAIVATPGPAFASAAELTALAELKRGNDAAAGALFKRIAEAPGVEDSLKSRAVQMAGMLGVDATETATAERAATAPTAAQPATKTGN